MVVSYIVPVYNAYPYLRRCVDSIINQTYSDLEILLIDDGSTDGSGTLCDLIKEQNSNISVFHISNQGASYARQYGLSKAKGDIVSFVDSDDIIHPRITELLLKPLLADEKLMISACKVERKVETELDAVMTFDEAKSDSTILTYGLLMKRFFKYEMWGYYAKLYRKCVFNGIFFPKATICEDYVVMAQLYVKSKYIYFNDHPMYFYNVHIGGLSTLSLSVRKFEEVDNMEWGYHFICRNASEYIPFARDLLLESCIKLYSLIYYEGKESYYIVQKKRLKSILLKNIHFLVLSRNLCFKVKLYAILLLLYPKISLLKK